MQDYPIVNGLPVDPLTSDHGGTGLSTSGLDSTKALMSDGANGFIMAAPAGGGGGTLSPPSFVALSGNSIVNETIINSAGTMAFINGTLTSNGHGCVTNITLSSGAVGTTLDLGATINPGRMLISPDGATLYIFDQASGKMFVVATAGMTLTTTVTLAAAAVSSDISHNGLIVIFCTGLNSLVYKIATAGFAITSFSAGHSSGNHVTGVCFYNNSNVTVAAAYINIPLIDTYSTVGVYASTLNTGQVGGAEQFSFMRGDGISNLYICDVGTLAFIVMAGSTPTIFPLNVNPYGVSLDQSDPTITLVYLTAQSLIYTTDAYSGGVDPLQPVSPPLVNSLFDHFTMGGGSGAVLASPTNVNLYAPVLLGGKYGLISLPISTPLPYPGTKGSLLVSDGNSNWASQPSINIANTSDVITLKIKGNSTQTNNLVEVHRNSDNFAGFTVSGDSLTTTANIFAVTTNAAVGGNLTVGQTSGGNLDVYSDALVIRKASTQIYLKTGANGHFGTGTLSGGSATVNNTSITANSVVMLFGQGGHTLANAGALFEDKGSRVAATSFAVKSSNGADNNDFWYYIFETF